MLRKFLPLTFFLVTPLILLWANTNVDKVYNVRQYGAKADGVTLDTKAIQDAINKASSDKGGTVLFPVGTYLTGSIRLLSNVVLQFDKGATMLGTADRTKYEKAYFFALIIAENQVNIGIKGEGVIDGNGKLLSADTERLAKEGIYPNAEEGYRPTIINFVACKNININKINLRNSAMWVQDYRECQYLTIQDITVKSNVARNNDGLDITDCKHVIVRGCDIDSEDDGICPKSSSKFTCDDILIENCRIRSSCNALKFGTASVGGFKNVRVRNLEIYDTYQSAIALEIVDGGVMENISISKIKITDSNNPFFIRLGNRNSPGPVGTVNGITISDVTAEIPMRANGSKSKYLDHWNHYKQGPLTGLIVGLPGYPIRNVKLKNINITYGGIGDTPEQPADAPSFLKKQVQIKNLSDVPQRKASYPEAFSFGIVPAWGIYIRYAEGIELDNVTVTLAHSGKDYRAALLCDDVKNISIKQLDVLHAGKEPIIVLNDVRGAKISKTKAPLGSVKFVEKMGNTIDVVELVK
jgi:Glycosyl hydrolases family 28